MLKRLLWTGIYGLAAVLLWLFGDHLMGGPRTVAGLGSGGLGGGSFIGTPGFVYLGSIICAVLSLLALIGKLPSVPEDEPNI